MAGGILAGFVTSFITAAVELSATILLTSAESQAPMSYGIYLYMQSVSGRGPGAALGVLAIPVVALGTYLSHRVVERTSQHTVQGRVDETLAPLPFAVARTMTCDVRARKGVAGRQVPLRLRRSRCAGLPCGARVPKAAAELALCPACAGLRSSNSPRRPSAARGNLRNAALLGARRGAAPAARPRLCEHQRAAWSKGSVLRAEAVAGG